MDSSKDPPKERVITVLARVVYCAKFIRKDGLFDRAAFVDALRYAGEEDPTFALHTYEPHMIDRGYIERAANSMLAITRRGEELSGV